VTDTEAPSAMGDRFVLVRMDSPSPSFSTGEVRPRARLLPVGPARTG
jgi:hypothetical protein